MPISIHRWFFKFLKIRYSKKRISHSTFKFKSRESVHMDIARISHSIQRFEYLFNTGKSNSISEGDIKLSEKSDDGILICHYPQEFTKPPAIGKAPHYRSGMRNMFKKLRNLSWFSLITSLTDLSGICHPWKFFLHRIISLLIINYFNQINRHRYKIHRVTPKIPLSFSLRLFSSNEVVRLP